MPTRSLTVAAVARIKPPKDGQIDYFDAGFPGLALRVSYGGGKAWTYFYRLHGKQHRMTLGRYPAMGLTEARETWRAARQAVAKGENPTHVRPTEADGFAAVAEQWLKRDQAKNRSVEQVRRTIERDVIPVWGERPIAGIARRDIGELIDGIADRGAVIMARRLHSHLHRLFRWAVGRGILEINPMADLPKPGSAVKRDRVLADAELAAIWKATEKLGWPFGPAIKLLTLTACRREEVGSLRWDEIVGNEIRLPAERSKNAEPRTIPLSTAAVELIGTLPRTGDHVFTTNGTSSISGWSKAKAALDEAAAEIAGAPLVPWRLHDARRTAATGLQRLGTRLEVVEDVLGHIAGSRAGVVGVYQRHRFEVEKRAALELWAAEVERIVAGKKAAAVPVDYMFEPAAAQLTLAGSAAAVTIKPINMEWIAAVAQADSDIDPAPLVAYLRQPGAQLGPGECWWLVQLLDRMRFKRKSVGNFVPLGKQSRKEQHQIGAAHVRALQRDEELSLAAAIDRVVSMYPVWFAGDAGASLANFLKRGDR